MTDSEATALVLEIERRMIKRLGYFNVNVRGRLKGYVRYFQNQDDAASWRRQVALERVELIQRRRRRAQWRRERREAEASAYNVTSGRAA